MSKGNKNSLYAKDLESAVRFMDSVRMDADEPRDITLAEYVKDRWGVSMGAFYQDLGIDPTSDTIHNLIQMPDTGYRWLIPEIYRDAIRAGIRKAPIYPNLIAGEQTVGGLELKMPQINMADAAPKKLGVAETIPLGEISFDQKSVKIYKMGRGVKIPYEVRNYVSLNLVSLFLQDFGVKMGMGLDYLALTTAINGDQADGSDAAPVVGIATANTLIYRDILKIFFRMARMGRTPTIQIAGEDMALNVSELYLATRLPEGEQRTRFNMRTSLPQSIDFFVHGAISANKLLLLEKGGGLIKLNAQPLLVEAERIVSNQTEATYATITTGFATLFKDARLVIDTSLTFAANGFPSYLDPTPFEVLPITKK